MPTLISWHCSREQLDGELLRPPGRGTLIPGQPSRDRLVLAALLLAGCWGSATVTTADSGSPAGPDAAASPADASSQPPDATTSPPPDASSPPPPVDATTAPPPDAGPETFGPNLLVDPGFEDGLGQYSGVARSWETNDAQSHPSFDFLDSSNCHSGTFCQRVAPMGAAWDSGILRQVTGYGSVTPGRTYELSGWVRTNGMVNSASWYVLGVWWFADDVEADPSKDLKNPRPAQNNYGWTELKLRGVAPANANRAAAVLSGHFDGEAVYDDLRLREVQ
jgi:hypothetical protein